MTEYLIPLLVVIVITILVTIKRSKKVKFIIWGLVTMILLPKMLGLPLSIYLFILIFPDAPSGILAGLIAIGIVMPLIFLVGLVLLLIGIFKIKRADLENNT
ncbi:hypothetical protein [Ornithinibacillus scapharcae]|uniref:hypothetical protein n=1 Tax=Ornithinibacillus scapharcae TaxID=1147159 RepID=UPI000225B043|nr:hypothetical protein [Ornithinibacillus scapharcae]